MKKREKASSAPRLNDEFKLLKSIGQLVHKRLYELDKPVEWLAWESETSRATIRRIFDGDRNIGIITIDRVAKALGYKNGVKDLLNDVKL